jgi:hypothetical protein
MFERVSFEALSRVTQKDFENLSLKDKVAIATLCNKAMRELNSGPIPLEKSEEEIIKALEEGVEDGQEV